MVESALWVDRVARVLSKKTDGKRIVDVNGGESRLNATGFR